MSVPLRRASPQVVSDPAGVGPHAMDNELYVYGHGGSPPPHDPGVRLSESPELFSSAEAPASPRPSVALLPLVGELSSVRDTHLPSSSASVGPSTVTLGIPVPRTKSSSLTKSSSANDSSESIGSSSSGDSSSARDSSSSNRLSSSSSDDLSSDRVAPPSLSHSPVQVGFATSCPASPPPISRSHSSVSSAEQDIQLSSAYADVFANAIELPPDLTSSSPIRKQEGTILNPFLILPHDPQVMEKAPSPVKGNEVGDTNGALSPTVEVEISNKETAPVRAPVSPTFTPKSATLAPVFPRHAPQMPPVAPVSHMDAFVTSTRPLTSATLEPVSSPQAVVSARVSSVSPTAMPVPSPAELSSPKVATVPPTEPPFFTTVLSPRIRPLDGAAALGPSSPGDVPFCPFSRLPLTSSVDPSATKWSPVGLSSVPSHKPNDKVHGKCTSPVGPLSPGVPKQGLSSEYASEAPHAKIVCDNTILKTSKRPRTDQDGFPVPSLSPSSQGKGEWSPRPGFATCRRLSYDVATEDNEAASGLGTSELQGSKEPRRTKNDRLNSPTGLQSSPVRTPMPLSSPCSADAPLALLSLFPTKLPHSIAETATESLQSPSARKPGLSTTQSHASSFAALPPAAQGAKPSYASVARARADMVVASPVADVVEWENGAGDVGIGSRLQKKRRVEHDPTVREPQKHRSPTRHHNQNSEYKWGSRSLRGTEEQGREPTESSGRNRCRHSSLVVQDLRGRLTELPLGNMAVCVTDFLDDEKPSKNDYALMEAAEDILKSERARRRTDEWAIARATRAVVVLTEGSRRGRKWDRMIRRHSNMTSAIHGISDGSPGSRNQRDSGSLSGSIFDKLDAKDVVVTLDRVALADCLKSPQYLRRVVLLIIDMGHCKAQGGEPSFADRDHPCSKIVREFYRALPEPQRPRILAVTSRNFTRYETPIVEYNLMVRFLNGDIGEGVSWKSCYGKGARPDDAGMMDVEHILYTAQSTIDAANPLTPSERRKQTSQARRDRGSMSEKEFLTEQLGVMGLWFIRRHQKQRKKRRLAQAQMCASRCRINSGFMERDFVLMRGLSQKVLHLLNEVHFAFAASTKSSKLMAVIYAGRPAVACGLRAIMKGFRVFNKLSIEVAVGTHGEKPAVSSTEESELLSSDWQGEDTDDEAVSNFASGETNILILGSPYCTGGKQNRPIPPCPLVLRFDDSVADPGTDGGGGRCRVVVFKEASKRKISRNPANQRKARDQNASPYKRNPSIAEEKAMFSSENSNEQVLQNEETGSKKGSLIDETKSKKPDTEAILSIPDRDEPKLRQTGTTPPVQAVEEEERDSSIYPCRPACALVGPNLEDLAPSYVYSVAIFTDKETIKMQTEQERAALGVENFLYVLSEKLRAEDLSIPIHNELSTASEGGAVVGVMKLSLESVLTLSKDQIVLAREYTAAIFRATSLRFRGMRFGWGCCENSRAGIGKDAFFGSEKPMNPNFFRRYLVLPSTLEVLESRKTPRTEAAAPKHGAKTAVAVAVANKINNYFSSNSLTCKPEPSDKRHQIDWANVSAFLELWGSEKKNSVVYRNNELNPEQYSQLEGKFIVGGMKNLPALISGEIQHNYNILSTVRRSKKFPLNTDGTFCPDEDLPHLVSIIASNETVALQTAAARRHLEASNSPKPDEVSPKTAVVADGAESAKAAPVTKRPTEVEQSLGKIGSVGDPDRRHVRWCAVEKQLVFQKESKTRKRKIKDSSPCFDASRNVKKKRLVWSGDIKYTFEKYYNTLSDSGLRSLDQPLLNTGRPRPFTYEELLKAIKGTPSTQLCGAMISTGPDKQLIPAELCNRYPLSIGALFLPSILFKLEQHLLICDLRHKFDKAIGVRGSIGDLCQSVTARHVNPAGNYERLELLGDSVLKLSCTVRLFTSRPHDSEGQMHKARAFRVSNDRLNRLGTAVGLHYYLQFTSETVEEWAPPGTETECKTQKVSMKGLADVVEAVCGAYFLFGMRSHVMQSIPSSEPNNSSQHDHSEPDAEIGSVTLSPDDKRSTLVEPGMEETDGISFMPVKAIPGMAEPRIRPFRPLAAANVERAYVAGYRFLEECKVLEGGEPTHKETLLAAVYAMHPRDAPPPTEISFEAFPRDRRLVHPTEPWEKQIGPLEKIIGHTFKRRPLLLCALTHPSYFKRGRSATDSQNFQRLEFLGDAVADFCVVWYLYQKYPDLGPGELTGLKSNVVSNEAFARTTVRLGLHKFLFHGSNAYANEIEKFIETMREEEEEGNHNLGGVKQALGEIAAPKVLGDIFEAVIGAIFVDSGLRKAWDVCMNLLSEPLRISADPFLSDEHAGQALQELVMSKYKVTTAAPRYVLEEEGQLVRGKVCSLYIHATKVATARGSTIKRAKLLAAKKALRLLGDEDKESVGRKLLVELMEEGTRRRIQAQRDFA